MNVRKVLAGSLAAIAAGATLAFGAFAAMGDYVPDSTMPVFVAGDNAAVMDVISLGDLTAAFAGYATTTTTVGGGAVTTVTGGQDLSTPNTKLYIASAINGARTTMTKTDSGLSDVLASGSFYDDSGTEYKYDQYITIGSSAILLGNSGGDLDEPTIYVNVGTSSAAPVYTTAVVFSKALNITSSDVQSNSITFFGNDYTIGSGSTATKLILYGGANKHTIQEGDSAPIAVGDVEHTVSVIGVSSSTQAVIEVDGVSKEVTEGSSYTISGDKGKIDVYVDAVWFFGKESQVSSVRLSLGSSKLTLESGQEVKSGTEDTGVDNTLVTITGSPLSKLEIAVAAQDSDLDHIAEGGPYTDPVFGGFSVAFGGLTPAIDAAERSTVHFSTSGDPDAQVKFTDYRGNEKTFVFAHDNDTVSGTITPILSDANAYPIHVVEGESIMEKEYFVISQGDFSHLYKLKDISNVGSTNAKVEFQDVIDGSTVTVNLASPGYSNATAYIDGQTYYVNATSTEVKVTWGTGASAGVPGGVAAAAGQTTVFPMLGGTNGEALALLNKNQTIANNTVVYLPGGSAGVTSHTLLTGTTLYTAGQANWLVNWTGTTGTIYGVALGSNIMLLNSPAVLILEEKGKDTSLADKRNVVGVLTGSDGTSPAKMSTETVYLSDTSSYSATSTANTYVTEYVDRYGAHVKLNTDSQGTVTVAYPDEQAYANVAIGPNPDFTTAGGAAEVETAVKLTTPVSKLASEVNTAALTTDLVIVGGPCINDLVATLAADGHVKNCADFIAACGDGTYAMGVIKEVANAFDSGQKALIVAGCGMDDTRSLSAKVMKGTLSYEG